MRADDLRQLVLDAFGPRLERLTPETLRDFVDRVQLDLTPDTPALPLVLDESAVSYDEVMRDFFLGTFEMEPEAAFVLLWLTAFEAWATLYLDVLEESAGPAEAHSDTTC